MSVYKYLKTSKNIKIMATYNVTNGNDSGSGTLREAIGRANINPGKDDIFVQVDVELTSSIDITDSVLIGTPYRASISQIGTDRIFNINNHDDSTIDVSLFKLNLSGGNSTSAGGAIFSLENLQLTSLELTQNQADFIGGAIYQANGQLDLEMSQLQENQARYGGGGLYIADSEYEISSSFVEDNESLVGGGIFSHRSEGEIFTSSISNNLGDGIAIIDSLGTSDKTTILQNTTVVGNNSSQDGGGIVSNNLESIDLTDEATVVSDNFPKETSALITLPERDRYEQYSLASLDRFLDTESNTYLFDLSVDVNPDLNTISDSIVPQKAEELLVLSENVDLLTGEIIDSAKAVHEFVDRETGAQLYTLDTAEKEFISTNSQNVFDYEGTAFYAFEQANSGAGVDLPLTAVYRLYNSGTDSYFYTTDRSEVNYISEVNGSEGSLVDQEPEIASYTVDV